MDRGQLLQKPVHRQRRLDPRRIAAQELLHSVQRDKLRRRPPAGMIDQITAHGSSRDREEVAAVLPIPVLGAHQAEIDLIHQFRRLQGMALALPAHQILRKPAQIRHHQRK